MKKQETGRTAPGPLWVTVMAELLKGGALAAVLTLLTALLCAVLLASGVVPEEQLSGAVLVCCGLGALAGGALPVRRLGRRPVPVGLGTGAVLFLSFLTAGALTGGAVGVEKQGLPILTACLCGGAGAGILARPPKKKRRR